jgi:site-specific DNA recombinase
MSQQQVAIYARVSSKQQAEDGTIESQLTALRQRVEHDGFHLSGELTFVDEGYSGANLIRPGLERLRDLVALRGLDRLYVHSPDRLARKYAYQVLLVDELQRAGVEVVFLNRELSETPEDELLLQVQGIIAEYERAKILERSRRGKRHAAQTGQVSVLSGAPYGYRYVTKDEGAGQARYEVLPEEARVVQLIFRWIGLERVSIGEVCRRLQKTGVRTRTGKATWDRSIIWGMLKNSAYKGLAAFGKTRAGPMAPRLRPQRGHPVQPRRPASITSVPEEDWVFIPVPALVDEALFDAVQLQLEENGLGRASAELATCFRAWSFVPTANMPTMANLSAENRPRAKCETMPTTAVSAPTPIVLAESESVIIYRYGPIYWTNWSGMRFVRCWKSPSALNRNISAAYRLPARKVRTSLPLRFGLLKCVVVSLV